MSHSHKFRNFLVAAGIACTSMAVYNRFTSKKADEIPLSGDDLCSRQFNWKLGTIFYTRQGSGSPVLLIHDYVSPAASWECSALTRELKDHTVYTLDLPGCGRSDKNFTAYTDYLYVQLISDFITKVIQEPTALVTSGRSVQLAVLMEKNDSSMLTHVIALNPFFGRSANTRGWIFGKLIELPVIGTFFYNRLLSSDRLEEYVEKKKLFSRPEPAHDYVAACFKASHMDGLHSKYLLSSYLLGYLNPSSAHSLRKLSVPFSVLIGTDVADYKKTTLFYREQNSQIEIRQIENGRVMMQMEHAADVAHQISSLL